MATVMEMIPNAFWTSLNNQNLADLLPPRWSILVNDAGVQCTLYWESSENAPPSPPPSPDPIQSKGLMRTKRHATHMAMQVAKRIRPNPFKSNSFNLMPIRNPLIQINPQISLSNPHYDGKKYEGGMGPVSLDPDVSRENALSNLSQALQQQLQNSRNIIRLGNNNPTISSKSSTPHTNDTPTPKSVIQSTDMINGTKGDENDEDDCAIVTNVHGRSQELSRRNSVLTEHILDDNVVSNKEGGTHDVDQLQGANNVQNLENSEDANENDGPFPIDDLQPNPNNIADGQPLPEPIHHNEHDDLRLDEVLKQRANFNSMVSEAAHAVITSQRDTLQNAQNIAQNQGPLGHQGGHNNHHGMVQGDVIISRQLVQNLQHGDTMRSQADVLKDNLANMKAELDSDCELVEDHDSHNGRSGNHSLSNLAISTQRGIVRPPLTFDPPGSIQRPSIGSISLPGAFLDGQRQNSNNVQKLVQRGGPLPYSKCPLTSVDKLAEQNGHKAELQALRQEANRGDEYLSMSRFVRTLSKIIFEPGELMVDSVKDIDKNKIAILLSETQRWYRANMAEVRQTLSIRLSEIRKSKRAAHWQTGRAQVMPQGWPNFPQNGTMPRYMNESRYFSALPIGGSRLALTEGDFAHIREMDA